MILVVEAAEKCVKPSYIITPAPKITPAKEHYAAERLLSPTMASSKILGFIIALMVSASALDQHQKNQEIFVTVQEMQHANYFTFVTLINMVRDKIPVNATFLMPNDKMLAKAAVPADKVLEFLQRHSIPSLLLFDDMKHFPTGTMIPTYQQDYMLNISNNGRKNFYLNNVQLISINICTTGSLFRCHGINDVLEMRDPSRSAPPTCGNTSAPNVAVQSPAPSLSQTPSSEPIVSPPPAVDPTIMSPAPVESSVRSGVPSSSDLLLHGLITDLAPCLMLLMMMTMLAM